MIVSERVTKTLNGISEKSYTERQLCNLLENVRTSDINDYEEEILVAAIIQKLRLDHPRKATLMFGKKDDELRGMLSSTHKKIEEKYYLLDNRVQNGVKTGGDMISGLAHIDVYISYKDHNNIACTLGFYQAAADAPLQIRVREYQTGNNRTVAPSMLVFEASQYEAAVCAYERLMSIKAPSR